MAARGRHEQVGEVWQVEKLRQNISRLQRQIAEGLVKGQDCLNNAKERTVTVKQNVENLIADVRECQAHAIKRVDFLRKLIGDADSIRADWPAGKPFPSCGVPPEVIQDVQAHQATAIGPSLNIETIEQRLTAARGAADYIRGGLERQLQEVAQVRTRAEGPTKGDAPDNIADGAPAVEHLQRRKRDVLELADKEFSLLVDLVRVEEALHSATGRHTREFEAILDSCEVRLGVVKGAIVLALQWHRELLSKVQQLQVKSQVAQSDTQAEESPQEGEPVAAEEAARRSQQGAAASTVFSSKAASPATAATPTTPATSASPATVSASLSVLPLNDVEQALRSWKPGQFFESRVQRAKATGRRDDIFLASQVLDSESNWALVEKHLGKGGFGAVEQVLVPTLGVRYALKTCKSDANDSERRARYNAEVYTLLTEMLIHSRVPWHANIAQALAMNDKSANQMGILYELGESDFYEYAAGRTEASLSDIALLLADAAAGLDMLRQHGFAHNDLKPENILVFPSESNRRRLSAKLTDLGLAQALGEFREGGTLGSKPPETMMGVRVECCTTQEVFALGHLMWLTFSKEEFKTPNMFLGKAGRTKEDTREVDRLSRADGIKYMEGMTLRNMVTPRFRSALLKPDYMYDGLGDIKENVFNAVDLALSRDAENRPPLPDMVKFLNMMGTALQVKENSVSTAAIVSVGIDAGENDAELPPAPEDPLNGHNLALPPMVSSEDSDFEGTGPDTDAAVAPPVTMDSHLWAAAGSGGGGSSASQVAPPSCAGGVPCRPQTTSAGSALTTNSLTGGGDEAAPSTLPSLLRPNTHALPTERAVEASFVIPSAEDRELATERMTSSSPSSSSSSSPSLAQRVGRVESPYHAGRLSVETRTITQIPHRQAHVEDQTTCEGHGGHVVGMGVSVGVGVDFGASGVEGAWHADGDVGGDTDFNSGFRRGDADGAPRGQHRRMAAAPGPAPIRTFGRDIQHVQRHPREGGRAGGRGRVASVQDFMQPHAMYFNRNVPLCRPHEHRGEAYGTMPTCYGDQQQKTPLAAASQRRTGHVTPPGFGSGRFLLTPSLVSPPQPARPPCRAAYAGVSPLSGPVSPAYGAPCNTPRFPSPTCANAMAGMHAPPPSSPFPIGPQTLSPTVPPPAVPLTPAIGTWGTGGGYPLLPSPHWIMQTAPMVSEAQGAWRGVGGGWQGGNGYGYGQPAYKQYVAVGDAGGRTRRLAGVVHS